MDSILKFRRPKEDTFPLDAGYKVVNANGQVLAYDYGVDDLRNARIAKALTRNELGASQQHRQAAKLAALGRKESKALQSYGDDVSGFGASDARVTFLDSALANLTKTTISSTSLLKVSRPSINTNSRSLQRTQSRFRDLIGASCERPSFLSSPLSET